jgi:hypothetical protein
VKDAHRFQRIGATSNAHAGREFEEAARLFWAREGIRLQPNFPVLVGYATKKPHKFDLGSEEPPILIECKSNTWTSGGNSPSAKIRGINEVMLYFSLAPDHYRKILFMLRHLKGEVSLAQHYVRTQGHLVCPAVEVWEFEPETMRAAQVV